MIHLGGSTDHSPELVLEKARQFFGADGIGLELVQSDHDLVYLTGGGGHVQVTVRTKDQQTAVDIQSQEWDYQAKQFLARL